MYWNLSQIIGMHSNFFQIYYSNLFQFIRISSDLLDSIRLYKSLEKVEIGNIPNNDMHFWTSQFL